MLYCGYSNRGVYQIIINIYIFELYRVHILIAKILGVWILDINLDGITVWLDLNNAGDLDIVDAAEQCSFPCHFPFAEIQISYSTDNAVGAVVGVQHRLSCPRVFQAIGNARRSDNR